MNPDPRQTMDALIERSLRGEASEEELAALAVWRRESQQHEIEYQRTARLIAAARAMQPVSSAIPERPSAASIVARAGAAGRSLSAGARFARWVPWALAAAAILVAALNVTMVRRGGAVTPAEIVTGATELATVKLRDGTVVRLAPSSRLLVPDGGAGREVTLEGRAFFAVARIPGQPFTVHTSAASARVLGTRFQLATENGGVDLQVLEGRVALEAPRNSVEVRAGEQSGVRDGTAAHPTRVAEPANTTEWLGKFLAFQATPLSEAAREIERLYGVRILLPDTALAAATVTATFTDRPIDDVLSVLCSVLDARCAARDGIFSITR
jgi:ferric-dicitrate binding protein FerR (iron transport regulator)